jgi:hypothetical protein
MKLDIIITICVCSCLCVISYTVIAGLNLKFELLTTEQDFYTAAEGTYCSTLCLLCHVMFCVKSFYSSLFYTMLLLHVNFPPCYLSKHTHTYTHSPPPLPSHTQAVAVSHRLYGVPQSTSKCSHACHRRAKQPLYGLYRKGPRQCQEVSSVV